jgi:hypothetical protein
MLMEVSMYHVKTEEFSSPYHQWVQQQAQGFNSTLNSQNRVLYILFFGFYTYSFLWSVEKPQFHRHSSKWLASTGR